MEYTIQYKKEHHIKCNCREKVTKLIQPTIDPFLCWWNCQRNVKLYSGRVRNLSAAILVDDISPIYSPQTANALLNRLNYSYRIQTGVRWDKMHRSYSRVFFRLSLRRCDRGDWKVATIATYLHILSVIIHHNYSLFLFVGNYSRFVCIKYSRSLWHW